MGSTSELSVTAEREYDQQSAGSHRSGHTQRGKVLARWLLNHDSALQW